MILWFNVVHTQASTSQHFKRCTKCLLQFYKWKAYIFHSCSYSYFLSMTIVKSYLQKVIIIISKWDVWIDAFSLDQRIALFYHLRTADVIFYIKRHKIKFWNLNIFDTFTRFSHNLLLLLLELLLLLFLEINYNMDYLLNIKMPQNFLSVFFFFIF